MQITFRKLHIVTGLFFSITFLSSCKAVEPEITGFRNVHFTKAQNGKLAIGAEISINNPNKFGFSVRKIMADVFMNDQLMGSGKNQKPVRVKKSSEQFYEVLMVTEATQLEAVFSGLTSLLGTRGKMNLRIKGTGTAGVFLYSKKFTFDISEKVDPSQFMDRN